MSKEFFPQIQIFIDKSVNSSVKNSRTTTLIYDPDMKNGSGGQRGRERALLQASRRLNVALVRASRFETPLGALDSVTLLTGACGARSPLSGRAFTVCVVSLLMGTLALVVACGQFAELSPCRNNSSKASCISKEYLIRQIILTRRPLILLCEVF